MKRYATRFERPVSSLSGSYIYFLLEAILRLNEGGRLVFITPTEFLDVRYGSAVKAALLDMCDLDEVVVLELDELAFEGVLTTSAITIATKRAKPSRRFRLTEARQNHHVERGRSVELSAELAPSHLPWTPLHVLRYIELGESLGLPDRFNCRSRSPWYSVERVESPDYFVTYMARERARFVRNGVGARCMTSLLNVWARPGIDPEALRPILDDPVNARLLREFGRTYGGGLGKIEPGDLLRLPVTPLEDAQAQLAIV